MTKNLHACLRSFASRTTQIRLAMPLMLDTAHQQGRIEFNGALGIVRNIVVAVGAYLVDLQRLDLPFQTAQLQPLKARWIESRGVPQGTGLEERGGVFERREHRRGREPVRAPDSHRHVGISVVALERNFKTILRLVHRELRVVVNPWEEPAAGQYTLSLHDALPI